MFRFGKATWILAAVMLLLTGSALWASYTGPGLPAPEKKPISIREHSVHSGTGHFHGGRSLTGRGLFWGK